MIFIITDKPPSVGMMHTFEGSKYATRIGDETVLSSEEPKIETFINKQVMYMFDVPTNQYNERVDYVIEGMRRFSNLPKDFPVTREWIDRGEGQELFAFVWWEVTFK